ncbi:MAG: phenylacetate--CoA ligase, partial [Dehalococcoidia bacterium]|nr:phenylacetate--CoA ligase [Dehalococcoidia bacterium]
MSLGKAETLSLPERQQLMDRAVRGAVEHAYHHAPAVREKRDRAGVSPADIPTARDLAELPGT